MACTIDYSGMNNIRICVGDTPVGGITEVKYGVFSEIKPMLTETVAGEVTATAATINAKLKSIAFNKKDETSNINEVATNSTNGSKVIVPTVTIQISGLTKETRDASEKLSKPNLRLVLLVKTADGITWCIGRKYGLYASQVTSATGVGSADFTGYSLTFTGEEDDHMAAITIS